MKKICGLNIIEPWELGTDKEIGVSIVDKNDNQYLLLLSQSRLMKNEKVQYLIAELKDQNQMIDLLSNELKGVFPVNLIYSQHIDTSNFKGYRIENFRSNFLLGDLILY